MSNYLRKTLNLSDVAIGLLFELPYRKKINKFTPEKITRIIKSYTLNLKKPFSINRAISTAGGVTFDSIDDNFMLKYNPHTNKLVVDIRINKLEVQQVTMYSETLRR